MFEKEYSIKFNEAKGIREAFPKATLSDMFALSRYGNAEDIKACKALYPEATVKDISKLVQGGTYHEIEHVRSYFNDPSMKEIQILLTGRRFTRWYADNKKAIRRLSMFTPVFALALHGLTGGLALAFFGSPAIVAYGAPMEAIKAFPALPEAVATMAKAAAPTTVSTSFFGGKGAILLHMLVAGFVTLVVSSFLKFTGRGDLIPLVAFVGGGIILYEVIGLFTDIYTAVKTMFQM